MAFNSRMNYNSHDRRNFHKGDSLFVGKPRLKPYLVLLVLLLRRVILDLELLDEVGGPRSRLRLLRPKCCAKAEFVDVIGVTQVNVSASRAAHRPTDPQRN